MPLIRTEEYKPNFLFRIGHVNTIYPHFFRKSPNPWQHRLRVSTPDLDFFDVDWIVTPPNQNLLILLHGLEGSSASPYMKAFGACFSQGGYDVAAIHFRSCSDQINHSRTLYHSGFTEDLAFFLQHHTNQYKRVYICGFSLGGSVTLNFASRFASQMPEFIQGFAAVSVPLDLVKSSAQLKKWENLPYTRRFLSTLTQKIQLKSSQFPDKIDAGALNHIRSLWDFDEHYTAPLHGFQSAQDYYEKCSSLPFLNDITVPTLIVNAKDDSFLSANCFPAALSQKHPYLHLLTPDFGGHVGFSSLNKKQYWIERIVVDFFESINKNLSNSFILNK